MDPLMLVLRVVHVVFGVFWAGTLFFVTLFLEPSVREAGPDGARVMQGLMQRRFMQVLPLSAVLTILSGLWLLWRVSAGFQPTWFGSATGITLSIGMTAAIVGFALGMSLMRPAQLRAMALAQALPQLPDDAARAAQQAVIQALRRRAAVTARWVAALLAAAVVTMAVARYV